MIICKIMNTTKLFTTFLFIVSLSVTALFADSIPLTNEVESFLKNGPTKAERIVVTYPISIGLLYVCGKTKNIVGCMLRPLWINSDRKLDEFYTRVSPNLASATDIGSVNSLETILALKPDFVVASSIAATTDTLIRVLNENKIPYLAVPVMGAGIDEWFKGVKLMGEATNTTNRTNAYLAYYQKCIDLVQSRVAKIPMEKRPKVAFINTNHGNMILRGGRTRFMYSLMKIAGAQLMEAGEDPGSSAQCAEMLFKFNPQIIIDDSRSDEFYKAEWFKLLKPVKEGKIYKTPQDDKQAWVTNWSQPTYSCLGLLWLAKIFHPEVFKDVDIEKEHKFFCENYIFNRD